MSSKLAAEKSSRTEIATEEVALDIICAFSEEELIASTDS